MLNLLFLLKQVQQRDVRTQDSTGIKYSMVPQTLKNHLPSFHLCGTVHGLEPSGSDVWNPYIMDSKYGPYSLNT